MKCPNCGSDNRDDAILCEKCEMPMSNNACPHCGTDLTNCEPIVKTTVTSSGGGYGFLSGCLGTVLLGPLGLLCGLRKTNTTSSSQTWWVCRKCGKEFVEKEAAKALINNTIENTAVATLVISLIWQFIHAVIGYNQWVRDIALLMIAGLWISITETIKASTGCTIKQLLGSEERKDFYKRCVVYGIGGFLIGAVVGGKVMQFLFS